MKKIYPGIDIAKFILACMIPFYHIGFANTLGITLIRFVARCGVPLFMASSGFFLAASIRKHGRYHALVHFEKKISLLLLTWLFLYSSLWIKPFLGDPFHVLQELLFKTPAYLWYLTAMVFAAIPFCLIQNRKILWGAAAVLYVAGTLLSDTYSWLTGGFPLYEKIFITTRNGLFMGLPFLCVGEILWKYKDTMRHEWINLLLCTLLLAGEMFFIRCNASEEADTSMYLMLPFFTLAFMKILINIQLEANTSTLRQMSSAIYVAQYAFIHVSTIKLPLLHIEGTALLWCTYFITIMGGIMLQYVVKKFPKLQFLI